ncbi:DNA-binding transcriptional regulator, AcrR family [Actinopolymorpha cephalotaxi]|uniref:AcrR family transcriptional regulator n=1 Tax=Actinopolymorpha cephalotaxi TaxID=504797 RepID=A0A1I2TD94_9ACTN|nr:TetR/AcrR family transcriptional regulator [Actinopolymorpha cephalotaxi]NYH83034.1 AcrR family transcriptional regulator [Actinopolymorpha cephalotaxi]SFG62862.1 DNA-binding transcriptional regulator, AcrR family [Actinopolymorpha cephalotaxi]
MATRRAATGRAADGDARALTLTERARRAQLIDITIDRVAEKGHAGTSLAGIAEAAGITKAAVLYHFATKETLVKAAYDQVLGALATDVAAATEAAGELAAPAAYVRSMIGHLHRHPRHTRMIVEAVSHGGAEHATQARWRPLAHLVDVAARARGGAGVDSRTLAIIIGGAIDAIVTERLRDPGFDTAGAADRLAELVEAALAG